MKHTSEEYGQCLACHEPILPGEFHPCKNPENCTDADCPLGATIIGWPHPIDGGCSCFSGEGPTGCMDDGDDLSEALRGLSHADLNLEYRFLKWLAGECRKVKYGHKETAEKAADSMHGKTGDFYDAYHCAACDAWHIGHSQKQL